MTSDIQLGSPTGKICGSNEPKLRLATGLITEVVGGLAVNGEEGNGIVEAKVKAESVERCTRFQMYQDL